jgi:predicted heme/steroid binding protein
MNELITYSKQELALRNGLNGSPTWIGYQGYIYDVSSSNLFKNGKHYRLKTGEDLTAYMTEAPHLEVVLSHFPIVGRL